MPRERNYYSETEIAEAISIAYSFKNLLGNKKAQGVAYAILELIRRENGTHTKGSKWQRVIDMLMGQGATE